MKSHFKIPALALLLATIPQAARCGELQKEFDAAHPKSPPISAKSRTYEQASAVQHEITEVGLERTGSLFVQGGVYTVIIKSDGSFSYTGDKNSKHPGSHSGHISTKDISSLFQYVSEIDFFALDDFYSVMATDQDQTFVMAAKTGGRKIVSVYGNGGPLKLWAFGQIIDALLADAAWDDPK